MNIVEFALKFKDLASSELGKFGTQAKRTFDNAGRLTNDLTGKNKILGSSYDVLQQKIRQVESVIRTSTIPSQIREARRELAALQRQSVRHPGNISFGGGSSRGGGFMSGALGMAGMAKFAGPAALLGVGMAAGRFFGESFNKGLERQQIKTTFNVLAGSEAAGGKLTQQLVDLETKTILGSEVFKNAQTMMGFGFKDTEVLSNMKMLGDISMGNADRLGMLTLAFSQSRAAGKLMGQDLLQFVNAGFNPLEYMVKRTGKSMMELRTDMQEGRISFGMVQQAFKDATSEGGKYNNMLETIGKTPAGMRAQIQGQWNNIKVGFGEAFMPFISMGLKLITALMPVIEGIIKPMSNGIEIAAKWMKSLTTEAGGLGGWIEIIKNNFTYAVFPVISKIWSLFTDIVGSVIEFVSQSTLLKDIFTGISLIFTGVMGAVGLLIDGLKWVFDNVVMPILKGIEWVYRAFMGRDTKGVFTKTVKTEAGKTLTEATNTDLLNNISQNTAANAEASKGTEKAISGGGPKVINITVQKFLDAININSTTLEAGVTDIEGKILEMFARVVSQGAVAI